MNTTQHPLTFAIIDLDAIMANVRAIREHTGPAVEFIAVVKANAYGHGAVQVARAALQAGATRLAVARADEGIKLREAGIDAPILVMGYTLPAASDAIVRHNLTATVNTIAGAQALSKQAQAQGKQAIIHTKIDTGMGRYGLLPEEVLPFFEQVKALPPLMIEGLFTHFAVADQADKTYTHQQFDTYLMVLDQLEANGYHIPLRHVANSATTLDLPEMHLDAVRVGIALYGLPPSDEVPPAVTLTPALSLHSHVARVRTLPPGSSISYGRTYITERDTAVALVPVGYGDGYQRIHSNRAAVLINGQRAPMVGRVCMDQFVVDVTDIDGVEQDSEVVLIGRQGSEYVTADELASLANTINYEITTGLLPRVPRLYLQDGKLSIRRPSM